MPLPTRRAARLPFEVPALCFGTSPLGSMPDTYGYEVGEARASDTIRAIFAATPALVDTSRNYGMGRSEARLGTVIREDGLPAGVRLSTKVDRTWEDNRLDAARARQSLEESLDALGVDRVDILHLHDPEYCRDQTELRGPGGAIEELFRMKEEGLAGAIGLAMGNLPLMTEILGEFEFDAIISHNRYSLLNRAADRLFTDAHARGIAILNAAPYAGGVLAKGSDGTDRITYQEAGEAEMAPVRAIETICARHGIPMGAAALQFSLRDPRIASTIIGVSRPERVRETIDWAETEIPADVWAELMALPFGRDDPEANRVYRPA